MQDRINDGGYRSTARTLLCGSKNEGSIPSSHPKFLRNEMTIKIQCPELWRRTLKASREVALYASKLLFRGSDI